VVIITETHLKVNRIIKNSPICSIDGKDLSILSILRKKSESELINLPDISEGLDNKIYNGIKLATSLDELYNSIKVKRYTLARIRRLVLCAALDIDNSFFLKTPPYIRIGGMNKKGEEILKNATKNSPVPIVVKPAQIAALGDTSKKLFEVENKATDLYNLFLSAPQKCGSEYTRKIIKTE
jgi:predicted nucleotidyltransferase